VPAAGRMMKVPAPLKRIPVLVRADAVLTDIRIY
jgi:alpha-glucosidase (family GH31 glycosyl hydrolase)